VDHETYYTVFDGDLVGLTPCAHLPASVAGLLSSRIELVLDRPVLTLGVWQGDPSRPDVLALDASGNLISVLAVNAGNVDDLQQTLQAIDSWLGQKRLRDLSDLSNDPASFYEGLWDLSPEASITLSSRRQFVLVTSTDHLDVRGWDSGLENATIEIQYFDVFEMPGEGTPLLKRRAPTPADPARSGTAIALADVIDLTTQEHNADIRDNVSSEPPCSFAASISGDETRMDPASGPTDLRAPHQSSVSPIDASVLSPTPRIQPGATFALDRLPLLFDPLGANLTSISDELFAVDQHFVVVKKLPELRRESPFENRNRFRWDTSVEQIELLTTHAVESTQRHRTIHLFVETDRQGGYCVYIGELVRINPAGPSSDGVAWFTITPALDVDLYRMLRNGGLPEHIGSPTIDFGTLDH
jgi:hypothetical protein